MTMNKRFIRSVYVDEELWNKARQRGINISELVNNVLAEILGDNKRLELAKIEEEIKQLRQRLAVLELKRQELLKAMQRNIEEKEREANLRKVLLAHKEAKGKYIRAETEEELSKYGKEETKLFNEALEIAGIQRGTPEFLTFSKLVKQGKVEEAVELAKRLWKTST